MLCIIGKQRRAAAPQQRLDAFHIIFITFLFMFYVMERRNVHVMQRRNVTTTA